MNRRINMRNKMAVLLCVLVLLLTSCRVHITVGTKDTLTGETYPDAEKYQTGAFTYHGDEIKAVEVYWRSGEVEITESDDSELHVRESGSELPENTAMHYFLDDGVLRIRFCESGAKIQVDTTDKHLSLEVPKNIDLSIHTTAALLKADELNQKNILIAAHSGDTELGEVTAEQVDLSSSAGSICADSVSVQSLTCRASSGSIDIDTVSVKELDCSTSAGSVAMSSICSEKAQVTTNSADVELTLTKVPSAEIQTSSGTVDLELARGGAELLYHSSSGELHTDGTYKRKGDLYVFGDGESKLTVETSSGNLEIMPGY